MPNTLFKCLGKIIIAELDRVMKVGVILVFIIPYNLDGYFFSHLTEWERDCYGLVTMKKVDY